jgi:ribosomal protein S18 acetylase RimI-like enzyme
MIRPTVPTDTPALVNLARETGVFKPHEIVALQEVLDDYHGESASEGHFSVTLEENGEILGFAYYAPASMTICSWYLYWIAVKKDTQAKGLGGQLLAFVEEDIRGRQDNAVLFIETSSLPHYELTRRFYLKKGYAQEAVLHDYYAPGDDMVVFRRALG